MLHVFVFKDQNLARIVAPVDTENNKLRTMQGGRTDYVWQGLCSG
jgi:hypothetical protein